MLTDIESVMHNTKRNLDTEDLKTLESLVNELQSLNESDQQEVIRYAEYLLAKHKAFDNTILNNILQLQHLFNNHHIEDWIKAISNYGVEDKDIIANGLTDILYRLKDVIKSNSTKE